MYFKSASVLRSIPMSAWLLPEHAKIDRIWWNAEVSASAVESGLMLNVWSMIWTSFLNPANAKCVIFETRRYSSSVDRENTCHILLLYLYLYPALLYFPIDPVIPWCNRGTCILMWNLYSLEKNFFDNLTTVKAINPTLISKVTFLNNSKA